MAPLRSADWRFLLPIAPDVRFTRLVVLGGPAGATERALSLGLGEHVTNQLPPSGDVEGVIAYGDASEPVDRIVRAVGPDGVLYLEIDRRRPGRRAATLGRVLRVLERAGLAVAAAYAVEPDLSDPRAFIPLGSRGATRWYRDTFLRADTPIARLRELARYSAISIAGLAGGRLVQRFAIVAVRGGRGGAPPGGVVIDGVARTFEGALPVMHAVVITYGGDRVTMFPFAHRGRSPIATVKVPRSDRFFDRTENEQSRLHAVRERLDPEMAQAVPRALGLVSTGRVLAAVEQFRPGTAMSSRAWSRFVPPWAKRDDLHCAMSWLIRFHRATEVRRAPWNDDLRCALVDEPLRAYAREFGTTGEEAVLFTRARAEAAALSGVELPIVCQHRDFTVWNLLRDHRRLAVLDWEGAREGPALGDALHLATTWLYAVRRGRNGGDEVRCLDELFLAAPAASRAGAAARRSIDRYTGALRIDRRLVPLLLVHHRVELALRRRDGARLRSEVWDAGAETAEVRGVRALAAGVDRLFPTGGNPA